MAVQMNAEGMAAVNSIPLWELVRDYEELGIFYIANDGMAVQIGTEEWGD